MIRRCCWILAALGIMGAGWFYPASALALSFFKELVSEEAIPNAELKIDSQGNLHAVFLSKNHEVRYATKTLSNWIIERVEEGGTGVLAQWVSLALDNQDRVHLAFYDPVSAQVKYAQKSFGNWLIIPVAPADNSQCRLAALDANKIYLAFNSSANTQNPGRLYLASIETAVPRVSTLEEIDAGGNLGYSPCLVLDASGRPHLTYYDQGLEKLKYAFKDITWQISIVDYTSPAGWQNALVLDPRGLPHIAYYDDLSASLKYAYKDIYGWHIRTLDGPGPVGQYPALVSDLRGQLFFVYYDAYWKNLKYAYKRNSQWVKGALAQVGIGEQGGQHITLVDNNAGEVRLLYYSYDSLTGSTKLYHGAVALPRVYVTSPRGGEVWPGGSTQIISWRASSSEICSYRIQYSTGLVWNTLADNLPPNQREYTWSLPSNISAKRSCLIKISGKGARDIIIAADQSPTFIICP